MIDFVKCIIKNVEPHTLKNNPILSFKTELCERTGLLGKSIAYHKGLKFIIYEPTLTYPDGRITFEGSLHKYFNDGRHNYNDFSVSDVLNVLDKLDLLFGFQTEDCIIKQIELGINFNPPQSSELIVQGCFMHGTKRFGWQSTRDEGHFIQSDSSRKMIKIYDKAIHYRKKGYPIKKEILRYEVKFKKMEFLNSKKIFTISDLMNRGLSEIVKNILVDEWKQVLYCDEIVLSGSKYFNNYSNINYWMRLAKNKYESFRYHRRNLNKLYDEKQINMKAKICELIKLKTDELDYKTI